MFTDRTVGRVLATAVASGRQLSASELVEHRDELARRALLHRVPGPLIEAFVEAGLEAPAVLVDRQMSDALARVTALHDLEFLHDVLSRVDVALLVFKGQVLTTLVGHDAWERPTSDLDVLISGADLETALDALVAAGAAHLDRNWSMMLDAVIGEVHLVLPSGTSLDLHWHLVVRDTSRRAIVPDHDRLFARARTIDLDGVAVRTFAPAETLVYSCFHAAISGGHLLVWLKDIEQLVLSDAPPWPEVIEVARTWGAELVVAAMLMRTRSGLHLTAAGLDDAIEALVPNRATRAVLAVVDRAVPVGAVTGGGGALRFLTRSIDVDESASVRSFVRRGITNTTRAVRRRSTPSAADLFDDVPGDDARRHYFDAVRAAAASR